MIVKNYAVLAIRFFRNTQYPNQGLRLMKFPGSNPSDAYLQSRQNLLELTAFIQGWGLQSGNFYDIRLFYRLKMGELIQLLAEQQMHNSLYGHSGQVRKSF